MAGTQFKSKIYKFKTIIQI